MESIEIKENEITIIRKKRRFETDFLELNEEDIKILRITEESKRIFIPDPKRKKSRNGRKSKKKNFNHY